MPKCLIYFCTQFWPCLLGFGPLFDFGFFAAAAAAVVVVVVAAVVCRFLAREDV